MTDQRTDDAATDDAPAKTTLTVTVDGVPMEAEPGEWLIATAERHGVYIPRFCYHPRMRPVGMCRMCLVEVDTGRGPGLMTACTVPSAEGMSVVTESPRVKKAQDGVLEFLLINHPLDCPVCDKGGECPLQDQTLAFGPGETRFVEEKRHWEKPISLSPLVYMDRERCILCDRCTRFADEVAGDPLISFIGRGNTTQVNTYPDHPFASYFSGNTVQICPVGALLAVPYRFRARPWDLDQVESTCTSCSVGCRMAVQSSSNRLVRNLGIDIDPVNWGWLCDKGRFDFEAWNSDERFGAPMVRQGGDLVEAGWGTALTTVAGALRAARDGAGPSSIGVLGGARLTNEDAYAWAKLAKGVLGTDNVDAQLGDGLPAEVVLGLPRATIDQACNASTIVLLGPDLKEELPVLYLRLRDAVTRRGVTLVELSPTATSMTPYAAASLRYQPGAAHELVRTLLGEGEGEGDRDQADALRRARAALAAEGPVVCVLGRPSLAEGAEHLVAAARQLLDFPDVGFLSALRRGNVHGALDMGLAPGILPGRVTLAEGRDHFAASWPGVPSTTGLDAAGILAAAAEGRIDTLVLLGADPVSDFPDRDLARRALERATVIAVDCHPNASNAHADVVLPAAGWGEKPGTTTNLEGRISRLNQKVTPPGTARPDWMIAVELAFRVGADLGFESHDDIWDELCRLAPAHEGVDRPLLHSAAGLDGIVVPLQGVPVDVVPRRWAETEMPAQVAADTQGGPRGTEVTVSGATDVPAAKSQGAGDVTDPQDLAESAGASGGTPDDPGRGGDGRDQVEAQEKAGEVASEQAGEGVLDPAREGSAGTPAAARPSLLRFTAEVTPPTPVVDSYSLRLVTARKLYDRGVLVQHSPGLRALAPEGGVRLHPAELARLGLDDGARVKVSSRRGSTVVAAMGDEGVPRGTVVAWFNQPGLDAATLVDGEAVVTAVRVDTVAAGEA